jgi:hypothetical protein
MYPMTNATNHNTTIPTAHETAEMGATDAMVEMDETEEMVETAKMLAAPVNTVEDLPGQLDLVDVTGILALLALLDPPDHKVK